MKSRKDDCEYLFVTHRKPTRQLTIGQFQKIIRQITERSPISKSVSPHILRHTTATIAINNGMPVQDIQKLLGHANINTTMIYAEASDNSVVNNHEKFIV